MPKSRLTFQIGIPIYHGVDLLDVAAPYEIFGWARQVVEKKVDLKVHLLAETTQPILTHNGMHILPQLSFKRSPQLDLIWTPGGRPSDLKRMMSHRPYLDFLRSQSQKATYVTSVCEGALLLASAGLLNGHKATTHWAFIPCLKAFPQIKIADGFPRFVVNKSKNKQGKLRYVVTGGGVSSGLDEALELVKLIFGKKVAENVQTTIQYFPQPPVHGVIPGSDECPLTGIKP